MDKFLTESRIREISGGRPPASKDAGEMDLTISSPGLSRSASLNSDYSVDSTVSVESDNSDKMAHLAAFFKFDKTHATCTKCGTKLKVKFNTLF